MKAWGVSESISLGLGTQEIKYRYTKSLDPKLIQINPVLILKHYYLKIHLNIIPIYYYILFNNNIFKKIWISATLWHLR